MGRQWEGRFYPEKGPRVERLLGVRKEVDPVNGITETEAFSKLVKIMGTYEAPKTKSKVTFSEVVPRFKTHKEAKNREDTTMAAIDVAIRLHLEPEFGPRHMDEIDSEDIEVWMVKELKKYSRKSVKNWRSVANSLWDFAVKKKMASVNVVAQTEAPYVPRAEKIDVMTWADIVAVRAAYPDTPMGWLNSLATLLACRCGLRESEVIALKWSEVMWDTGWLRVIEGHVRGKTKLPKGKKGRITPMPGIVKDALLAHFKTTSFNRPDDLVLAHPVDGSELNASALNERFKEAVVQAGIRPTELRRYKKRNGDYEMRDYVALSFHDCRHAWASWCLSNGQAPANVQKWGGWEDAKTMAIYDHFIPSGFEVDQLNAAVERESAARV